VTRRSFICSSEINVHAQLSQSTSLHVSSRTVSAADENARTVHQNICCASSSKLLKAVLCVAVGCVQYLSTQHTSRSGLHSTHFHSHSLLTALSAKERAAHAATCKAITSGWRLTACSLPQLLCLVPDLLYSLLMIHLSHSDHTAHITTAPHLAPALSLAFPNKAADSIDRLVGWRHLAGSDAA
jgi:hypothetical protein